MKNGLFIITSIKKDRAAKKTSPDQQYPKRYLSKEGFAINNVVGFLRIVNFEFLPSNLTINSSV